MTQLKHADVIKHMVDNGYPSVECPQIGDDGNMPTVTQYFNPVTAPKYQWRIKPTTLTINVEIPKPETEPLKEGTEFWILFSSNSYTWREPIGEYLKNVLSSGRVYTSRENRDEAERILTAALRGEK